MLTDTGRVRVLVVEDEAVLASVIADYLRADGYDVAVVGDGARAVELARESAPHVVVLDLGLPTVDGVEVCRRLRQFSDAYVVMLTARADEAEVLRGLRSGADDYMTKPFSPRELVARVRVMFRRPRRTQSDRALPEMPEPARMLTVGGLTLDLDAREVAVDGEPVLLTRLEFDVLAALASRPGVVFSRAALIRAVWGEGWVGDEHLVDVHVLHVRRKLGDTAQQQRFVRTVRGVGYRMGPG